VLSANTVIRNARAVSLSVGVLHYGRVEAARKLRVFRWYRSRRWYRYWVRHRHRQRFRRPRYGLSLPPPAPPPMITPPRPRITIPPGSTNLKADFSAALAGPPLICSIPVLRPTLPPTYSLPSAPACAVVPHGTLCVSPDGTTASGETTSRADFLKQARRLLSEVSLVGTGNGPSSQPALPLVLGNSFAVRFIWSRPAFRSVFLAWDYNGWGLPTAMTRRAVAGDTGRGDVWETVLRLPVGTYFYKYIVDGEWRLDPDTISEETPRHGMANKLIIDPTRPG
jgi:hypothetical protein